MSRRHSGPVASAVTPKTLCFHCLNSHVKQRLHAACTNTSESVLTVSTLISKHYTSISCLLPVTSSKLIRTPFLTLALARSGQIGSVSAPKPSVSPNFSTDLTQTQPTLLQKSSLRTYLNTLKNTVLLTPTLPQNTQTHRKTFHDSSGTLATLCKLCVTRLCLLNHRNFTFYFSAQVFCSVHPPAVLESSL